jgi:hypothetical protein
MSALSHQAYHDSIDTIESHEVVLTREEQLSFLANLHEVLTAKLEALRAGTDYEDEDHKPL